MKRIIFTALALAMAASLVGCSGDSNSCNDACKMFERCGFLDGSVSQCADECEQALDDKEVTDSFVDCLADSSCTNIDRC